MLRSSLLILVFSLLLGRTSIATDDPKWAGNLEMNGYRLDSFSGFAEKWKLVTVRYRMDSGEFRFIYANPVAWKALESRQNRYPDGAVFAKVGYVLSHDSSFPSSLVPSRVARYQLMVRDEKKHSDTGGWGYAVYNSAGRTFPGNPKSVSMACNACHQLVSARGAVFATPIDTRIKLFSDSYPKAKKIRFQPTPVAQLPTRLSSLLPKGTKSVQSIEGDLRKNLFAGTLDEIRPFLSTEAIRSKMPAVLMSSDSLQFSAVFVDSKSKGGCESSGGKSQAMIFLMTASPDEAFRPAIAYAPHPVDPKGLVTESFCFSLDQDTKSR